MNRDGTGGGGSGSPSGWRSRSCSSPSSADLAMEDGMRRHVLYLVGTVGAAFLAALLIAVVVDPRLVGPALSGHARQPSAILSLGLVGGSGYAMYRWLQYAISARSRLHR